MPLTSELATSGYGYKISNTGAPISNLFCMDDLKLYSKNEQEQIGELKVVSNSSVMVSVWNLDLRNVPKPVSRKVN